MPNSKCQVVTKAWITELEFAPEAENMIIPNYGGSKLRRMLLLKKKVVRTSPMSKENCLKLIRYKISTH